MAGALYLQHVDGLEPCPLCIFQRVGVMAAALVLLVASLHGPKRIGVRLYGLLTAPAAGALIKHISLLIFPLGVGIVLQWHRYEDYAVALAVAVVIGTILSMLLVTLMLKKLMSKAGEPHEP